MTNNNQRTTAQVDAPNPWANNVHGQIIELTESDDDATVTTFTWEIFILCGDPNNPADGTLFAGADPSLVSPISSPDNITLTVRGIGGLPPMVSPAPSERTMASLWSPWMGASGDLCASSSVVQ